MPVEDHVYEAAVRGRREMRQAYREARAARGEDRTLTAVHARADLRFLLACITELEDATGERIEPGDIARYIAAQAALVRVLNTAIATLEASGNGFSAQNARQGRDEALALGPGDPDD